MVLEAPRSDAVSPRRGRQFARSAFGWAGAVDAFTGIGGDPDAIRVIEVNSEPVDPAAGAIRAAAT